jgi:hypothetical protein
MQQEKPLSAATNREVTVFYFLAVLRLVLRLVCHLIDCAGLFMFDCVQASRRVISLCSLVFLFFFLGHCPTGPRDLSLNAPGYTSFFLEPIAGRRQLVSLSFFDFVHARLSFSLCFFRYIVLTKILKKKLTVREWYKFLGNFLSKKKTTKRKLD